MMLRFNQEGERAIEIGKWRDLSLSATASRAELLAEAQPVLSGESPPASNYFFESLQVVQDLVLDLNLEAAPLRWRRVGFEYFFKTILQRRLENRKGDLDAAESAQAGSLKLDCFPAA